MKLFLAPLLDLGYLLTALVTLPWLAWRHLRHGGPGDFLSRFGVGLEAGAASCIWLHGASAGEVLLLQPLVRRLERDLPRTPIVVSAFSSTGLAAGRRVFPRHRVLCFPVDLSIVVSRFLGRLRPRLVVIAEGDLWPNFLLAARRRGIPVVVLNGRISEPSCRRHALMRVVPSLMRAMPFVAVQTEEHARRLGRLGLAPERVHVTGNMKYDLAPPPSDPGEIRALRERLGYRAGDTLIVGGSLHPGEDEALLRAFRRAGRETRRAVALVLVPRYPADAGRVEQRAREQGFPVFRKTATERSGAPPGAAGVLVVDTLGELRSLYAAADIAFVGGSLPIRARRRGGHNLMEPAIAGVPVLFGPDHGSFAETARVLLDGEGGAVVHDWQDLARHLLRLVEDPPARRRMGERARAAIVSRRGATGRNYTLLQSLLRADSGRRPAPSEGISPCGAAPERRAR